jgi:hypothetical protein
MRSLRPSLIAILVISLPLMGCQKLFTTSLAEGLTRTNYPIPANISNADAASLLSDSSLPSAALASLLAVLNDQAAAGDPGAAALAAKAAVGASGVTSTIMPTLASIAIGGSLSSSDISSLVSTIQAGANSEVVDGLMRLRSGTDDIAANDLNPTQLIVAATLLAASALDPGVNPADLSPTDLSAYQTDPKVTLAADLVAEATKHLSNTAIADTLSGYFKTGTP